MPLITQATANSNNILRVVPQTDAKMCYKVIIVDIVDSIFNEV
jgi:hypothetical protein